MARKLPSAALALAAFWALAQAASARQEPPPPQAGFQEKVEVREVLLDALVTDAKGNVIIGLDKSDFAVREKGRPVELTGVTFYSNRRLVESAEAVAHKGINVDQVPEDRYFILFFDDQKDNAVDAPQLLTRQMDAGRRAADWISRDLLPNDYVAVVSYDKKLKVQQDFTRNRSDLVAAVGAALRGKDSEGNWPSRIDPKGGPSLFAGLPRGNDLRDKTATIYDAVRLLAQASGSIPRRKNLLLFTAGFGSVSTFNQYIPDPRYYPPMMEALNGSNVAAYTIDLVPQGVHHPLSDAMNQLSDETGGRYFFDVVNFLTPLEQTAKENSGYYLLSYRGEHPAGAKGFQEVEVRTTNPEFRVRARRGYEYGRQ